MKNVRPSSGLNSDLPPPKKGHIHILIPVPVSVSLFEKRVFADAIKLRISRGAHPGLREALNQMTNVLTRDRMREDPET